MPRKSKAAAARVPEPLRLPEELTIYTVGELHPQWLAWLQAVPVDGRATAEAAAVDQVDAAGLQLLLSLQRALAARGASFELRQPSDALRGGCDALGLSAWLHASGAPA